MLQSSHGIPQSVRIPLSHVFKPLYFFFGMECGTLWSIGILARIAAKDEFARMRFCFDPLSYLDVNK